MKNAKFSNQPILKLMSKLQDFILILSATLGVFIESSFSPKFVFGIFFDIIFWFTISGLYVTYFWNKGSKNLRKYFLHTIYILITLFAVLFQLKNPGSGVAQIITLLTLFISGSIFLNVFRQTLFLVFAILLRFGFSEFFAPMDPYFHYSLIVIVIISIVSGFFLINFEKTIRDTNALFMESNQMLIELDQIYAPKYNNAGFHSHPGFEENEVMFVPPTLEIMPVTGHNSNGKSVILDYPNLKVESAKKVKNDYKSELQLPFLINCLRKDLAREGITLKTQLINEFKFQDLKMRCGEMVDHLHDFFLSEKEFNSGKIVIDNTTTFNEFIISSEFNWQREFSLAGIPSDLRSAVYDLGGKCFYNSDQNENSRLIICLPNPQVIPGSKFSILNLHSLTDLVFVNEIINAMDRFLCSLDFSVENLSRELGTSRMQLHRKVKGSFGMSPGSLFQYLRMKKAEFLLKSGYSRISDIAYSLGYCDQSHFSKAFRAWSGYPPVEYMRKNQA